MFALEDVLRDRLEGTGRCERQIVHVGGEGTPQNLDRRVVSCVKVFFEPFAHRFDHLRVGVEEKFDQCPALSEEFIDSGVNLVHETRWDEVASRFDEPELETTRTDVAADFTGLLIHRFEFGAVQDDFRHFDPIGIGVPVRFHFVGVGFFLDTLRVPLFDGDGAGVDVTTCAGRPQRERDTDGIGRLELSRGREGHVGCLPHFFRRDQKTRRGLWYHFVCQGLHGSWALSCVCFGGRECSDSLPSLSFSSFQSKDSKPYRTEEVLLIGAVPSMTIDELKQMLNSEGCVIKEEKALSDGNGMQFILDNEAQANHYPKNGKVVFQGKNKQLCERLKGLADSSSSSFRNSNGTHSIKKKVFVVYGHDTTSRNELEVLLRRWQLEPVILDQLPSEGQTVIEKLESYTGENIGFGVVLATPDDEGHKKGIPSEKQYRARQNVVLELGILLAKLGRKKVAILMKGHEMERPSDIQGLIYLPFTDNLIEEVKVNLFKEMRQQGYDIDPNHL